MATDFDFPDGMDPQVFMDEDGREVPNPNPIVIHFPSGPVSDYDRVRELIRRELSLEAAQRDQESFEDANDFDVDDDLFPVSPHEYDADTEEADREALAAEVERQKKASSRQKKLKAGNVGEASSESGVQPDSAPPDEPDAPGL